MTLINWLPETLLQEVLVDGKYTLIEVTHHDQSRQQRQCIVLSDDDEALVLRRFNERTLAIQDQGFSRRNLDDRSRSFCKTDFSVIPPHSAYVELWITEGD